MGLVEDFNRVGSGIEGSERSSENLWLTFSDAADGYPNWL